MSEGPPITRKKGFEIPDGMVTKIKVAVAQRGILMKDAAREAFELWLSWLPAEGETPVPITIRLTREHYDKLKAYGEEQHRHPEEITRQALALFLDAGTTPAAATVQDYSEVPKVNPTLPLEIPPRYRMLQTIEERLGPAHAFFEFMEYCYELATNRVSRPKADSGENPIETPNSESSESRDSLDATGRGDTSADGRLPEQKSSNSERGKGSQAGDH